ncbi:uracil-DNA glycosylase [Methanococcoides sp. AM1]|uniref:uracil-DNA glycosylase n=1 Tax=Methanococcoides sp. AM1 TaxID=1201011 RepID=UPI0010823D4B|nr:uracil-DNA glycosylase [Methanococcoides sp. AM1]
MTSEWKTLEVVEKYIFECTACPLSDTVINKVIRKGSEKPKVLFIGEAPGKNEDETGVPFCGRAGKILDELIDYAGLEDSDWAVINTIKCRPPKNRNPNKKELEACKPFLKRQIELLDPKLIILLGNTAEKAFLNGHKMEWGSVEEFEGRDVLKIFHPAALIYTRSRTDDQHRFIDENRHLFS